MKVPPRYCRPIYVSFPTFRSDLNLRTSVLTNPGSKVSKRHTYVRPSWLKVVPNFKPEGLKTHALAKHVHLYM